MAAVIGVGENPVGVHADDAGITAFFDSSGSAETNGTSNGHDDVSAFVHQGDTEFLTLGLVVEGAW